MRIHHHCFIMIAYQNDNDKTDVIMSYKKIMVAVDGSKTTDLVLKEALYFSTSLNAHLCIVHVVDVYPIYNLGIDFDRCREIVINDGMAMLETIKEKMANQSVVIETKLVELIDGEMRISEKLIETIKTYKSDLLILGTHGRRGFNRLILGSVAEETVRISPIPILLVPSKKEN